VNLDGSMRGTTPAVIPDVPPGNHELILSLKGYDDWNQMISVGSGQTSAVNVILVATPVSTGSLAVTSDPTGADIFIDDGFNGVSPLTISGLLPGTHTVTAKLQGYTDTSTNITIIAGQTGRTQLVLEKVRQLSTLDILLAAGVVLMIAAIAVMVMVRQDTKR